MHYRLFMTSERAPNAFNLFRNVHGILSLKKKIAGKKLIPPPCFVWKKKTKSDRIVRNSKKTNQNIFPDP
jgi:hypothetical protein